MMSIGSQVLTLNELQTVVFEVANLLNQTTIGVKLIDDIEITCLCANDLLMGRSSKRVPSGGGKSKIGFTQRIIYNFWHLANVLF